MTILQHSQLQNIFKYFETLKSEEIESPMGGNIAAFKKKSDGQPYLVKFKAAELKWEEVIK